MSSSKQSLQFLLRANRRSAIHRAASRQCTRPMSHLGSSVWKAGNARPWWTAVAVGGVAVGLWSVSQASGDLERWLPVVYADAPAVIDDNAPVLEKSTGAFFPSQLSSISAQALKLVGVGVRTVSFLRVKVYGAGFYLDERTLGRVGKLSGNPNEEQYWEDLLSGDVTCAILIIPSRNTDFAHLRDGFTRALAARQKIAAKASTITSADEERISHAIQQFKSFFPNSSLPKGKELLLVRTSGGSLAVEYDGKVLGKLDNAWVAKEMMVAYFADKNVISQPLKDDVARGIAAAVAGRK